MTSSLFPLDQNKAVVAAFMADFSKARLDDAFALLDDEMRWSMWGSGPGAGVYTKEAMRALLIESWKWFDGNVTWMPERMTAEDDRIMVEARSDARTIGGYHHQNVYHNLFRVRAGRIVEIKEMFQEQRVAMLFTQLAVEADRPIAI